MQPSVSIPLKKGNNLPALSDNTFLRYFNFIALYFAQGVPEGMLFFGIPAWMAMNGKTAGEIAGFAIVCGLPWSFKFIVAPLMDRYTYLPMGRKRPWVIFGQLGLMAGCIAMAYLPDPLNNLNLLMAAGFVISFFGAFQDVATDGMAVDIIPIHQQARANGLMWGSKIIGISASLALGSWLLNKYSFSVAILMLALVIGTIMLVPVFLRERQGEKIVPWSAGAAAPETKKMQLGSWATIFRSLYRVFSLRNSLLLTSILFVAQGAYNYIDTALPIFTVKALGWTNVTYSQYYASAKLIGGIGGMLIGGILIDRFGKKNMMSIYFFFMILLTSGLAFLKTFWVSTALIYGFMILHNVLYTFACIGIFAIAMQCCWKKVSASQFTLYMTIGNLGRIAFAALLGPIKANFSWEITLFSFAVMIAVALLLLRFLNINKQVASIIHINSKDPHAG
ncbi:MAG: MFS transporter [Chitinophagaceae bacterium]|nr:MFS transporter [Chitinophagaceae bacterium]